LTWKILKKLKNMKKELIDENLIRIVKKTTPYQRMVWLKKNFEFWKKMEIKRRGKRTKAVA